MSTAIKAGRAKARKLVNKIMADHGYLPESFLQTLTLDQRRTVEIAMGKKDDIIASAVTS